MSNRHRESPGSPQITAPDPPFATKPIPPYRHRRHNAAFDPAFPRALTRTDLALLGFRRPNAASDAPLPSPIHQRAVSELQTGWLTQNVERERRNASIPPTLETAPWTVHVVQSIEEGSDPYTALKRATEDYLRRIDVERDARVELEDRVRTMQGEIDELDEECDELVAKGERYRIGRNEEIRRRRALQAQVQTLTDQLAAAQNPANQPAGPVRGGGRGGARGGARGGVRGGARRGARGGARGRAGRDGRGAAAAAAAEIRTQPQRKCKVVKR